MNGHIYLYNAESSSQAWGQGSQGRHPTAPSTLSPRYDGILFMLPWQQVALEREGAKGEGERFRYLQGRQSMFL